VQVTGDTVGEADETVFVDLSAPTAPTGTTPPPLNATIGTSRGTGTIINDDAALTIEDVRVVEGDSGTSNAVFTVRLSNRASDAPVTVNFSTANGSATAGTPGAAGSDYQAVSGTLTFEAGETEKEISVPIFGDTSAELDETFNVTLQNAQNAAITRGTATGTIANDETQLEINDVRIVEGDAGTSLAIFTVKRLGAANQAATVKFATADGTATADGDDPDYVAKSGTLSFTAGQTSATIAVEVRGDLRGEFDEQFFLNLSEATNATIADTQGEATIVDNDSPGLQIDDVGVFESNDGTRVAKFTVTLAAASDREVKVNFGTANDTATAGTDYSATSGVLTFAPGVVSQTIDVPIIGDGIDELDERFFVNLSGATNATISDGQGTGTIRNDDLTVSIGDVTLAEGNAGTSDAVFTISLSSASTHPVTVTFSTRDGSATVADGDYTAANGTITFAPGVTSQTIRVPVTGDNKAEGAETFSVVLDTITNAQIGKGTGVATIANDDTPTLSVADVVVAEGDLDAQGNPQTKNAIFTIRLSNPSTQRVTVNFATQNGSATVEDGDYADATGTVTFNPGEVEKTVSVQIIGDAKAEPDETFTLNLSEPVNATLADGSAIGTIRDMRTLTVENVREAEGNAGSKVFKFTISLDAPGESPVSVDFATQDRTATVADGDYNATSGTVQFAIGERTKELEVVVNGDTKNEPIRHS
jgi:hypothetical protein